MSYYAVAEDYVHEFIHPEAGHKRLHFRYAIYRTGSDRVVFRAERHGLAKTLESNLNSIEEETEAVA